MEGLDTQTVAAIVVASLGGAAGLRKLYIDWMKTKPEVASAAATEAQFKALREQIEHLQADNKALHTAFNEMDLKLHRQQTKLTRTEMLVRQFVGLVKERGVEVPAFMQSELDDLLKPEA